MGKTMSESEAYEILKRIEAATSKSQLIAIRKILEEYNEDDPKVKKLVKMIR